MNAGGTPRRVAVITFCTFVVFVIAATVQRRWHGARRTPTTISELTQAYERETIFYQQASEDRDEQERVIDQLEQLDRALPADKQEQAYREIAKLEEHRGRLCEDTQRHALRVSDAKQALDLAHSKH